MEKVMDKKVREKVASELVRIAKNLTASDVVVYKKSHKIDLTIDADFYKKFKTHKEFVDYLNDAAYHFIEQYDPADGKWYNENIETKVGGVKIEEISSRKVKVTGSVNVKITYYDLESNVNSGMSLWKKWWEKGDYSL